MADGSPHAFAPAIGPATEARILAAFALRAVITAKAAAALLGLDPKTLDAMVDAGTIRAVRRGTGDARGYTEGDIRAFLTEGAAPCRSRAPAPTVHARPVPTQARPDKVVSFIARRQARRG